LLLLVLSEVLLSVEGTHSSPQFSQSYMNTTAGSFALLGSVPQDDSTMVKKLKAAGAIILAKANLSRKSLRYSHVQG
jgi:hypothetical protein